MEISPKEVLLKFVDAFNKADADALAALYSEHAVNHQVAEQPVKGREAIQTMFADSFAEADMTCIVENVFEDGEWAIMEWRDPLGLRGCGFFYVIDGEIVFQRGYWDKLSFLRQQGFPIPENKKSLSNALNKTPQPASKRSGFFYCGLDERGFWAGQS
jgi:limonene-1,2-epoxide hydrolase